MPNCKLNLKQKFVNNAKNEILRRMNYMKSISELYKKWSLDVSSLMKKRQFFSAWLNFRFLFCKYWCVQFKIMIIFFMRWVYKAKIAWPMNVIRHESVVLFFLLFGLSRQSALSWMHKMQTNLNSYKIDAKWIYFRARNC